MQDITYLSLYKPVSAHILYYKGRWRAVRSIDYVGALLRCNGPKKFDVVELDMVHDQY